MLNCGMRISIKKNYLVCINSFISQRVTKKNGINFRLLTKIAEVEFLIDMSFLTEQNVSNYVGSIQMYRSYKGLHKYSCNFLTIDANF